MPRKQLDWTAIARDWKLGRWSNQELARRHGCSHTIINRNANGCPDKNGKPTKPVWVRNLAPAVMAETQSLLARDGLLDKDELEIVQQRARENVDLIRTHQLELAEDRSQLKEIEQLIAAKLENWKKRTWPASEKEISWLTEQRDKLSRIRQRIQDGERKAHALDAQQEPPEDQITDDQLLDELERVLKGGS